MTTRHESIQLLRGIAALLVVIHHAISIDPAGSDAFRRTILPSVPAFAGFGSVGVDLFFVISGFVMANSLGTASARRFLVQRAIRILPLFWLVSAVMIVQQASIGNWPSWHGVLNTVTLVPLFDGPTYHYPPLYVGWTLGFEAAFYVLVAVVIACRRGARAQWLALLTISVALVGGAMNPTVIAMSFIANPILGEFALGVLAWLVWHRGMPERCAAILVVVGVLLLLSGLCIDAGQGFAIDPLSILHGETSGRRLVVWGVPAALLLTGLVCGRTRDRGRGRQGGGPLLAIGDASYAIYLIHPFVIAESFAWQARSHVTNAYLLVTLLVLTSIGIGLILHAFVEKPLLRMMRNRVTRPAARPSVNVPAIAA